MQNRKMETSIGCRIGKWRHLLDEEQEHGDFYWMYTVQQNTVENGDIYRMKNRNMETSIGCTVEQENGDFYWMQNSKMETYIGCRIGKLRLLLDGEK